MTQPSLQFQCFFFWRRRRRTPVLYLEIGVVHGDVLAVRYHPHTDYRVLQILEDRFNVAQPLL